MEPYYNNNDNNAKYSYLILMNSIIGQGKKLPTMGIGLKGREMIGNWQGIWGKTNCK
jgi:hypothetical protein